MCDTKTLENNIDILLKYMNYSFWKLNLLSITMIIQIDVLQIILL